MSWLLTSQNSVWGCFDNFVVGGDMDFFTWLDIDVIRFKRFAVPQCRLHINYSVEWLAAVIYSHPTTLCPNLVPKSRSNLSSLWAFYLWQTVDMPDTHDYTISDRKIPIRGIRSTASATRLSLSCVAKGKWKARNASWFVTDFQSLFSVRCSPFFSDVMHIIINLNNIIARIEKKNHCTCHVSCSCKCTLQNYSRQCRYVCTMSSFLNPSKIRAK